MNHQSPPRAAPVNTETQRGECKREHHVPASDCSLPPADTVSDAERQEGGRARGRDAPAAKYNFPPAVSMHVPEPHKDELLLPPAEVTPPTHVTCIEELLDSMVSIETASHPDSVAPMKTFTLPPPTGLLDPAEGTLEATGRSRLSQSSPVPSVAPSPMETSPFMGGRTPVMTPVTPLHTSTLTMPLLQLAPFCSHPDLVAFCEKIVGPMPPQKLDSDMREMRRLATRFADDQKLRFREQLKQEPEEGAPRKILASRREARVSRRKRKEFQNAMDSMTRDLMHENWLLKEAISRGLETGFETGEAGRLQKRARR